MQRSLPNPKVGDVWYAILESTAGREQSGFRPVIVVSNDEFNRLDNSLVYIVPVTTRNRSFDLHVPIEAGNGGLPRDCVAMCDQLRSVDTSRLKKHQGSLSAETLATIRHIISLIVADESSAY